MGKVDVGGRETAGVFGRQIAMSRQRADFHFLGREQTHDMFVASEQENLVSLFRERTQYTNCRLRSIDVQIDQDIVEDEW